MKRTNNKKHDEFIEREILIGMIVSTDYLEKIHKVDPTKYLASSMPKRMAGWCLEYFSKYQKAPGEDIEGIYFEKLKDGLPKDIGEEIEEEILPGLSEEYTKKDIDFAFLFDRTFSYFQDRQLELHEEKLRECRDSGEREKAWALQSRFKPLQDPRYEEEELSITEYFTADIPDPEWLVDDLIPKGLTILAGAPKTGKSYFALYKALHLGQRRKMFDAGFKGTSGSILYLALEDPRKRIAERVRSILRNPKLTRLEQTMEIKHTWPHLARGGLHELEAWLESKEHPALIVIDTFARVAPIKTSTSAGRWYQEEYSAYAPLADLAHKYDTSIILITHTKKGKEKDVFNEILGGSGTQAAADNLVVMSKVPNRKEQRQLAVRGKEIEDSHWTFEVSNAGAKWTYLGDAYEVQKTDERQEIYDYVKGLGTDGARVKDITEACKDGLIDVSPNSVQVILRKMVGNGKLEQPKTYGRYYADGEYQKKVNQKVALKGMEE